MCRPCAAADEGPAARRTGRLIRRHRRMAHRAAAHAGGRSADRCRKSLDSSFAPRKESRRDRSSSRRRASSIWKSLALMSRLRRSLPSRSVYVRGVKRPSMYTRRPFWIHCCARSASVDQQLTRYQSVCSCRSSAVPGTRLTATLNSQTGRPFGVIRSSGSRPTLPMMTILLTEAMSLVPSHHEVAEDVFREPYGALELARLVRRQREFDDAVLAVTVVGDLVGEPTLLVGDDLVDLAAEGGDRLLDALAHGAEALFVDGRRAEVHE